MVSFGRPAGAAAAVRTATRTAALVLLVTGVALAGCVRAPVGAAPAPGLPAAGSGAPEKAFQPDLVLEVPLGPGPDQPALAAPRPVGGVAAAGPGGLAVGPDRTVYLLDSVRGGILAYRDGRLQRSVDLPFLSDGARGLQLVGDRLRVSDRAVLYEVDLLGRIWRATARPDGGGGPASGPDPAREKGAVQRIGQDGAGNAYVRALDPASGAGAIVRRLDPQGRELARAVDVPDAVDLHVAGDGSVYALRWRLREGAGHALVHRILPPHAGGPAAATPAALADPPRPDMVPDPPPPPPFAGVPAPDHLKLRSPDWPEVTVTDRTVIHNLWHLLGTLPPGKRSEVAPGGARAVVAFVDQGGAAREIRVDPGGVRLDDREWVGDAGAILALLRAEGYAPRRIADAARGGRVAVLIPDLPGASRTLDAAAAAEVANMLAAAARAGASEPPRPLEPPFPRYALRFEGAGWKATATFAGERHVLINEEGGHEAPALSVPPTLLELARRALPVPRTAPGNPGHLYGATRLEIAVGEGRQDLTRWRATVVRHLLGVLPPPGGAAAPVFRDPISFIFTVDGRSEVVRVDARGFSYAGRFHPRAGLTNLAHLQGVP